jgi:hypothetical protein
MGRNFMCTWSNIWWKKNINQECVSSHGNLHESFCSNEQRFGAPSPFYTTKVSLLLQNLHVFYEGFTLHASCCGVSKWKFFIHQSIHGLCRTSQDNPMMTWFLWDEMTLKTTLLVWELMVTSNGLVSWVIGPNEKL